MEDVLEWLNGPKDAKTGLSLLVKYRHADAAKKFGIDMESQRRLFFAVKSLLRENDAPLKREKSVQLPGQEVNTAAQAAEDNKASADAKRAADILYKEMQNKRAILFEMAEAKEKPFENEPGIMAQRKTLVEEVMKLDGQVREAYDAYRFALKHGKLPEEEKKVHMPDPVFLYHRISNLRKSISKYRNKKTALSVQQIGRMQSQEMELQQLLKEYENAGKH